MDGGDLGDFDFEAHEAEFEHLDTERHPLRRRIIAAILVISVVSAIVFGTLLAFLLHGGRGFVRVASLDDFAGHRVLYVTDLRAYIVDDVAGLVALSGRGVQSGQPVRYCGGTDTFEDPVDGTVYDRVGRVVQGPAPRGLDRYTLRLKGRDIYLNPFAIEPGPPRTGPITHFTGPTCGGEPTALGSSGPAGAGILAA